MSNRVSSISRLTVLAACFAAAIAATGVAQQAPPLPKQYIFPANGQTPEVQQADEQACGAWATQQSGFDPTAAPPPPKPTPPPPDPAQAAKGRRRAAVKGAAAGYIVGDVANNEGGEGAAIGAVVGVASASRKQQGQAQAQQQQAAAVQQQDAAKVAALQQEFLKARTACLEAKGYTVK